MLQVGSLLDKKYKILSEVGHGGMSVVYLAINERANKTWAVKEVRKDGVCNFEAVKQGLVVETDMLKKLNHPYLPSIIDVIDLEDSFLIVMDYIEGKSLQSVLKNSGAQPQDKVIKWGIQLCDVLGYLHSRQPSIIYRDMKPANVMLKPTGDITLIDFGTAREFKDRSMVEDTTCLGTRGYAAPEQFGGRGQTDPRTDIYCLGATLYHLVTGHSPAEPPYEIKPLSYWDPSFYGSGLEQIINKCCQQDPAARYQSCAELMYDLEHVHDMDVVVQHKRAQKWNAFIASIAVFAVGLVGTIGFSIAKDAAMRESYDYYVDQAKVATDFDSFTENIKQAINVNPGNYDAYDVLVSRIEQDGVFDLQSEWPALMACMNGTDDSGNKNENQLLNEDPQNYGDIQFRIGRLHFLMTAGTDSNLKDSVGYFNRALNQGGMAESTDPAVQVKANIAKSLSTIGASIDSLNSGGNLFTDQEYGYVDLYSDLTEIVNSYTIDSMGAKQYGVSLYNRVASLLGRYTSEFKNNGISAEQMLELAGQIETALLQTSQNLTATESSSQTFIDLLNNALVNVTTAKNKASALAGGAE